MVLKDHQDSEYRKVRQKPAVRQRRKRGDATFRDLINAAVAIWSESGVNAVSMNAVASRAGRTRGTMYHHFANRDALLDAVRDHLDDAFAELFANGELYSGNPYEAFARFAADSPELVRFYLRSLLDRQHDDDPLLRAGLKYQADLAESGKLFKGIEVDHVSHVIIGMWFAAALAVFAGDSQRSRRQLGRRFAITFEHVMRQSFLESSPDPTVDEPIKPSPKRQRC